MIAQKNVKACTVQTRTQKKKRKIVEQNSPKKEQQKIWLKIFGLFLSDEIRTSLKIIKIKDRWGNDPI